MAKNPIFPLYYNDLLGSTKTWTDEEFGAYVRLLIEQWDNGFIPNPYQNATKMLPNDIPPDFQRLTRIATSVERNWELLSKKFTQTTDGLQNEKLEEIRCLKRKHAEKQKENVLKRYQTSTKPSTKNLPLEDENEIEYILCRIREIDKEGTVTAELEKHFLMLILKMMEVFRKANPDYFFHKETDYGACLQIAYHIATMKKWTKESVVNGKMTDCLDSWQTIVEFVKEDKWFSSRSLSDLASIKEWQRLVQQMKKIENGTHQKSSFVPGRDNPHDKL
jgi:uncharacterized protein YdaU (DUF1376 family)